MTGRLGQAHPIVFPLLVRQLPQLRDRVIAVLAPMLRAAMEDGQIARRDPTAWFWRLLANPRKIGKVLMLPRFILLVRRTQT